MQSFLFRLLSGLRTHVRRRPAPRLRPGIRPALEAMEDRLVPSTTALKPAIPVTPPSAVQAVSMVQHIEVHPTASQLHLVECGFRPATAAGATKLSPQVVAASRTAKPPLVSHPSHPLPSAGKVRRSTAKQATAKAALSSPHANLNKHDVLTSPGAAGVIHVQSGVAADKTDACKDPTMGAYTLTGTTYGAYLGSIATPGLGTAAGAAIGGGIGAGIGYIVRSVGCNDLSGKDSSRPDSPDGPSDSGKDAGAPTPSQDNQPGPPQPPKPPQGDPPPGGGDKSGSSDNKSGDSGNGDQSGDKKPDSPNMCTPDHPEQGYPQPDGNGPGGPKGIVADLQISVSALTAVHALAGQHFA